MEWQPHGRSTAEMRHIRLSREDVSKREPVQMCQALSRFFQEVDPVEDLLHRMLNGLKPPQIVVLGDDSSSFLSKVCNLFGLRQIAKFLFASNKILFNFCDIQIERTFCLDSTLTLNLRRVQGNLPSLSSWLCFPSSRASAAAVHGWRSTCACDGRLASAAPP